MQECVLVLIADRMACIPIAPAQNAAGQVAVGVAMTIAGLIVIRDEAIDLRRFAMVDDLDALMGESGGFIVGAEWTYSTRIPIVGTMLTRWNENISTRGVIPQAMLSRLIPNRAPLPLGPLMVACGIGAAIIAVAGIVSVATGNLELLFGIGFWGVFVIAITLFMYAWMRLRGN